MDKNCKHCDAPNPEGYFNCPECGERASESLWTINTIIRDTPMAKAIRQDKINFGSKDMGEHMEEIQKKDSTVKGFNIGTNMGKVAGQTILHAHIHLIPRRVGDVENPRGGVRNIIPGKGDY